MPKGLAGKGAWDGGRTALWRPRLGGQGAGGAGVRLEICGELGTLLFSLHLRPPPVQPGFGPSRRLCENVPGAGRQPCSSWSRTRTSSLPAPRSEGQPLWGSPRLRSWGLLTPEEEGSSPPSAAHWPQMLRPGCGPCHSCPSMGPICPTGTAARVGKEPLPWPICPAPGVRLPRAVCACGGHLGGDGKCHLQPLSLRPRCSGHPSLALPAGDFLQALHPPSVGGGPGMPRPGTPRGRRGSSTVAGCPTPALGNLPSSR